MSIHLFIEPINRRYRILAKNILTFLFDSWYFKFVIFEQFEIFLDAVVRVDYVQLELYMIANWIWLLVLVQLILLWLLLILISRRRRQS